MEFKRLARGTIPPPGDEVRFLTGQLRRGVVCTPQLYGLLEARGVDPRRAVLASWQLIGRGQYGGVLITPDRRVLEITLELAELPLWTVDDVTEDLGRLDPAHPLCDRRQPVARGLRILDDERAASYST